MFVSRLSGGLQSDRKEDGAPRHFQIDRKRLLHQVFDVIGLGWHKKYPRFYIP